MFKGRPPKKGKKAPVVPVKKERPVKPGKPVKPDVDALVKQLSSGMQRNMDAINSMDMD